MTVEVKSEETHVGEVPQEEPKRVVEESEKVVEVTQVETDDASKPVIVQKSSSYKEESNFLSDLKEFEKKALSEFKTKLEEAILGNTLFKKDEHKRKEKLKAVKEEEKKKEEEKQEEGEKLCEEEKKEEVVVAEEKVEEVKKEEIVEEKKEEVVVVEQQAEDKKEEVVVVVEEEKKEEVVVVVEEEKKEEVVVVEENVVDKDISLWGIPLLPSKGSEGTDVVLLKFLRAREFKVNDAFEMLKRTLVWRKESNIDSILEEELEVDLSSAFYMNGVSREGHHVCYNIYGVFADDELYSKALGSEEKRKQFLRFRFQLMEKGIQKLDLKPGAVTSLIQISDLKNSPAPSKKELKSAMNQAVNLLQDNYPEFVAKNIFINVPFWYYAINALLSPFLTQRTKSKFVFARPAKVTETLLKYIPAEEIPVHYGGFKRENDFEFFGEDGQVTELCMKGGSTETIEIPAEEVGATLLWDLTVLGWEVNYKEEFVPTDENSYTIIVQKAKKMSSTEAPIRNTFKTNEVGKIVLTLQNCTSKKKRILYRYKTKKSAC